MSGRHRGAVIVKREEGRKFQRLVPMLAVGVDSDRPAVGRRNRFSSGKIRMRRNTKMQVFRLFERGKVPWTGDKICNLAIRKQSTGLLGRDAPRRKSAREQVPVPFGGLDPFL